MVWQFRVWVTNYIFLVVNFARSLSGMTEFFGSTFVKGRVIRALNWPFYVSFGAEVDIWLVGSSLAFKAERDLFSVGDCRVPDAVCMGLSFAVSDNRNFDPLFIKLDVYFEYSFTLLCQTSLRVKEMFLIKIAIVIKIIVQPFLWKADMLHF